VEMWYLLIHRQSKGGVNQNTNLHQNAGLLKVSSSCSLPSSSNQERFTDYWKVGLSYCRGSLEKKRTLRVQVSRWRKTLGSVESLCWSCLVCRFRQQILLWADVRLNWVLSHMGGTKANQ
jgi:hypothetical protein